MKNIQDVMASYNNHMAAVDELDKLVGAAGGKIPLKYVPLTLIDGISEMAGEGNFNEDKLQRILSEDDVKIKNSANTDNIQSIDSGRKSLARQVLTSKRNANG